MNKGSQGILRSRYVRKNAPLLMAAVGGCASVVVGRKLQEEKQELQEQEPSSFSQALLAVTNRLFSSSAVTVKCEAPAPPLPPETPALQAFVTTFESPPDFSSPDNADNNNNNPDTITSNGYPNFSRHGPKAILPKYLTPQLYEQLKDLKTPTFGVTLEDMISAGTMLPYGANPPRGVAGVYAGDADCYTVFAPLLLPLVEEYHGVSLGEGGSNAWNVGKTITRPVMRRAQIQPEEAQDTPIVTRHKQKTRQIKLKRHETNLDPEQILNTKVDPSGEYILYTRMRLARNLEGFAFATAIQRKDRRRIERLFQTIVEEDFQPLQGGAYVPVHSMTNEQHEHYMTRRMCFLDPDEFKLAAGLGRDWPDARGIYCCSHWDSSLRRRHISSVRRTEVPPTDIDYWEENPPNVCIWANYDDHFWVVSVNKGGNVQSVFKNLSDAVRQLELSLMERNYNFCVHPKLGFLTSSPTNVGTALRASMSVKLIRLGKEHPAFFQEILDRLHLEAKSDYAETDQRYTGIFDIANAERLGRTEVQWINIMIQGVQKLIELEKKLERGENVTLQDVDEVVKEVKKE